MEKAFEILEKNTSVGIVYCKAELFGKERGEWDLKPYSLKEVLNCNCIFVSAVFRKSDWEAVGGFNGNMIYSLEDWDFWLSLIEKGVEVYQIPEFLFFYRKHSVSRTVLALGSEKKATRQIILNHLSLYAKNIGLLRQEMLLAFFDKKNPQKSNQKKPSVLRMFFEKPIFSTDVGTESISIFSNLYTSYLRDVVERKQVMLFNRFSERDVSFMSKAASPKDGKDVSAFFQDIPVHRSLLEEK